jgi:sugar phosphate isomerase/epimerase
MVLPIRYCQKGLPAIASGGMHLSTHNWMRAEPLEVTLARIKRLGYESIEISGEPAQYPREPTRALLNRYGIRCWGAVTLTLGERNLAAKEPIQRARSVQYMKSVVQMVADLDGQIITIVPATVGKVSPDSTPDNEWAWVRDGLQDIYQLAQRLGVRMAIEPLNRFETYFINRADQALAMATAVGPDCGVCLDTFHLNIEEADLLAAVRLGGTRIYDFHVADNNRLAPGQGTLDWTAIVQTLQAVGYDGALTAEFVAPIDRTPVTRYPNQLEQDPSCISAEQLKFIQDHGSSLLSEEFYTSLAAKSAATLLPLMR